MAKKFDEKKDSKKTEETKKSKVDETPVIIEGELCPFCNEKKLTLMDSTKEIPYFGTCFLFSMDCSGCGYHKADIEAEEAREPSKYTIELSEEKDMSIRIIKSSFATVKLPHVGDIMPGPASNGYVTNVEGILNRMVKQIEVIANSQGGEGEEGEEIDDEARKKAKNMIKKLKRVIWGQEKQKLIIEDPTGNSAIISDKAVKEKLKVSKKDE